MADSSYGTIAGFVQFDPNTREYNGQDIVDVVVRSIASGENVRCTVWPEFNVEIERGDFIAADGKVKTNTYKDKTGTERTGKNLSVTNILVLSPVAKTPSEVVTSKTGA